ncbi:MAG: hypothetical protein HN683_11870 [Gammaproteobacteria bacterium]|nr:hypothetical protein [Gammaproteobacteria bacterium]MBT7540029.1 hypothetical protein [Gammaproteobacteria bacterium]
MKYQTRERRPSDGTTHVLFSPLDFISKLVALVPRPRRHLVRYMVCLRPMLASAL